jgi:hypothetical protein
MTENNRFVDDLSLEFFLNKDVYGKHLEKRSVESKREYIKDKRFYRKRIYELTKQFLHGEEETIQNYSKDLHMAFDVYTRVCIDYFKLLDKNDILQEDYCNLLNSSTEINQNPNLDVENIHSVEDANNLLMRSIKLVEPNSLEKLVKRTITKAVKKEHLPLQKEINLKDPVFKKKGVKKKDKNPNNSVVEKNNINIIYDKDEKK